MLFIYSIFFVCLFFQAERGVGDTLACLRMLDHLGQPPKRLRRRLKTLTKRNLFILIPVLEEQKTIKETLVRFACLSHPSFNVRVIVVTTAREDRQYTKTAKKTTEEVVRTSLRRGRLRAWRERIEIIRAPEKNGNMATQLNYALMTLRKRGEYKSWFLVYNADSIISNRTLEELVVTLNDNRGQLDFAVQQPCAFVKYLEPESSNFVNALSLYQTFYCLGHENRLIRQYEYVTNGPASFSVPQLGVIVGHGSGMQLRLHELHGGYPTNLLTEDLTFGYILSANSIPIRSIKALEIADVPITFLARIKQHSVWYWNYIGYLFCARRLRKEGYPLSLLLPLSLRGISRGVYWLLLSFFVAIPFVIGALKGSATLLSIASMGVILFYLLPHYLVLLLLPNVLRKQGFEERATRIAHIKFFKLVLPLIGVILTDSIGPWIGTLQGLYYLLTGRFPKKHKTTHV